LTKKFPLLFNKKTFELLCEGAEWALRQINLNAIS
jgi:hypothetical protein